MPGHVLVEVLALEEALAALCALVARLLAALVHAPHVPGKAVLALDVRVALAAPATGGGGGDSVRCESSRKGTGCVRNM